MPVAPLFSVVIPLYNKGSHILRAVQSVLRQSVQNFEIIVVNDGSTDGGEKIVAEICDSRISLLHQKNSGVSVARNSGIAASRGELVSFLDADDEWMPNFLEVVQCLQRQFPFAGIYATSYQITKFNGSVLPKYSNIPTDPHWEGILSSYFRAAAFGAPPVCASAVAIPREILFSLGGFLDGKRMGEDLELWGRIALYYKVAFSNTAASVYHHDAENRACSSFRLGDENPFVNTVSQSYQPFADSLQHINLYVDRLLLDDARLHTLAKHFTSAVEMTSTHKFLAFKIRKFLWATRFNYVSYVLWNLLVLTGIGRYRIK